MTAPVTVDEATAWRVLAVRDIETSAAGSPTWTAADRAWATRLAQQTAGSAGAAAFVAERARHALQRLRSQGAAPADVPPQRSVAAWAVAAAAVAFAFGLLVDRIGPAQRIELLAPPVLAVLAWNVAVYAALVLMIGRGLGPWRQRLLAFWAPAPPGPTSWAEATRPAKAARLALLLHLGAAALAAGVIAGMYLRGLVLDYRAGWQSTFLDAGAVHRWLSVLLQPAAALTGVALPPPESLARLRIGAGGAAQGDAAPWIHLYAATLALWVVGPRALLAAWSAAQAHRRSRRIALPLHEPYFQRLLRQRGGSSAAVRVQACGWTPPPEVLTALRELLEPELGDEIAFSPLEMAADDDGDTTRPARAAGAPPALAVMLFDLASTPEAEVHGRALARLAGAAAPARVQAVVGESGYVARMAAYPQRIEERRRLWRDFAREAGVEVTFAALPQAPR